MKDIRVNRVYIVFEKLDKFYDDDDSTYITAFDNSDDAYDYVAKNPQHNYYVQEKGVYKTVK